MGLPKHFIDLRVGLAETFRDALSSGESRRKRESRHPGQIGALFLIAGRLPTRRLPLPCNGRPPGAPVLEGKVIGQRMKRHWHQEFIRFLNVIEARVPTKLAIHVIVDNYAAHKHPNVLEWLAYQPRFVFHFTPTSASWLNAVEGLFALLSKRRLKRGIFRSVQELKDAIHDFIGRTNAQSQAIHLDQRP
jgi:transposase